MDKKQKSTDNNLGIPDSQLPMLPWTKHCKERQQQVDAFLLAHKGEGFSRRQARNKTRKS